MKTGGEEILQEAAWLLDFSYIDLRETKMPRGFIFKSSSPDLACDECRVEP